MSSFFERLTGSRINDEDAGEKTALSKKDFLDEEIKEEEEDGQLTVDMYQTPNEIIVQAIVAGIKSIDDLDVSISHEMVTIRGKREDSRSVEKENFYYQELYWGTFSRSLILPEEIDPNEAEASFKHGMLTVRLPKLHKDRVQKLKVKNE